MVRRMRASDGTGRDEFEKTALRITGGAFYLLAAGLAVTAAVNIYQGHRPSTTVWGIIIGALSIASMWLLIHYKVKTGRALNSDAILADAACTRTCLRLSFVLLAASIGYELTGAGYIDSAGTLVIAWMSLGEGREALGKAKGLSCSCGGKCHDTADSSLHSE
jgi:divalent metal cation (Fe/Co/Zn/Cd) transporter